MVHRREGLQSSVWNLAAKYNVHIEEDGWRYPRQLVEWLEEQLPEVAWVESQLVIDQILQLQRHIGQMEEAIEDQGDFTPELELIQPHPSVGLVTGSTIFDYVVDIA